MLAWQRMALGDNTAMNQCTTACGCKGKFELGQTVMTAGTAPFLRQNPDLMMSLLNRHRQGDWGDISAEDKKLNDEAVLNDADEDQRGRVLSSYNVENGDDEKIWIITEEDRSATTFLWPFEY
jgi:hypothetical protein